MNAQATAQRVLAWAVSPAGPPPEGPLWDAGQLARPDPRTMTLAGELARVTAAKLGTGAPPFADHGSVGAGPVLLASAAGGRRQPELAQRLAQVLPPARPARTRPDQACWPDLVARHGLVAAVLASGQAPDGGPGASGRGAGSGDEPLTETLVRMSPLTAVLYRPARRRLAAGTTGDEVEVASALAGRSRGLPVLAAGLAEWSAEPGVLNWRVELLERLSHDHPALILDTCTLARLRHGADWDLRLRWAHRTLSTPGPPDPLAIATIRFWTPLARLVQRGFRLADVRPLLGGYKDALDLVRYYRLLTTGVS